MKMLVQQFRTNDLNPSEGKQIEFGKNAFEEITSGKKIEGNVKFVYKSEDSLNNSTINVICTYISDRTNYKLYQNNGESLKRFFIGKLNLSENSVGKDFFTVSYVKNNFEFSYFPATSEVGKFFESNKLSGNVININDDNNKILNIPHPLNRIVFGAPGTGKSHKLENESSLFVDTTTTQIDDDELMKQEIYALGSDRSNSFAIGIKYFDKLKDKKIRDLQTEYNCNRHSAYAIYQAIRVCEKIGQLPDFGDEISDDKVKQELDELLKIKYMNQAGAAAIGFKYSDHLDGRTISELKEDFSFGEGGSLAHWMYYGVQAANYQFDKFEAKSIKKIERVTFHPNYSYAQFVGTYKPVQDKNDNEKILYSYIPGPFMRVYVNAKKNPKKNFLLLIEEINRANVAAVFGDVFQLLDRKSDGTSQYLIAASEDQKNYLESCGINDDEISIPSNMYIWATMNSADQGVQPMDAAFKRRWDFEYIGIDDNEESVKDYVLPIPQKNSDGNIFYTSENWNKIRKAINNKLKNIYGVNEDKLLGPYFLSKSTLDEAKKINYETETDKAEKICSLFKSKVLMYLYEDVVKMNPTELFSKSEFESDKPIHYSDLCNKFDKVGLKIFGEEFVKDNG